MASVNDYGDTAEDRLDLPKLGGTDGWAAAVAAALDGSDVTVNARLAAKVSKSGDTMSGDLHIVGNTTFAGPKLYLGPDGNRGSIRYAGRGVGFVLDDADESGADVDRQNLIIAANPTRGDHAINRNYADLLAGAEGSIVPATGWKDYGGDWGSPAVTRVGKVVTGEGLIQRAGSSLAVTKGATYWIGTIPSGYRPAKNRMTSAVMAADGVTANSKWCRVNIQTDGGLYLLAPATETLNGTAWVGVLDSWRTA